MSSDHLLGESDMAPTRIGIVGARSYTARELIGRLLRHRDVEIVLLTGRVEEDLSLDDVHPSLRGRCAVPIVAADEDHLATQCDLVFLCLPHGPAAELAKKIAPRGVKIVDLSADFRFTDLALYERAYGQSHAAPDLNAGAVYGLPELWRDRIRAAQVVGNPGCYPTSVLMALAPLVRQFPSAIPATGIVADCKSGVSGAGRTLTESSHFCEANEGLTPYKVATHRHGPEIDEQISLVGGSKRHVTFIPHLTPMDRGICATVHIPWVGAMPSLGEIHAAFTSFANGEPFLRVLPLGKTPGTKNVMNTNLVDIGLAADTEANMLIVMTAIDNLVKGASGQAIQCMNLMIGSDEAEALL